MSPLVGVDLGASAVRVVEISGLNSKDSCAQITKAAVVPLGPGAIVAGRIQQTTTVAWALSRALKEARISPYGVVLGLTSPACAVARVAMPAALTPQEWAPVLRTMDRPLSPMVPIARSALSMYQVGQSTGADGQVESRTLLAGAVLAEEVAAIRQVCREAGVTPKAIDLAGAATLRATTRLPLGNEDVATLVDVGASKVTVATRQGLHLRSLRTLEGGGDKVTRAVMGVTGGTFEQAEELKLSMRLAPGAQARRRAQAAEAVASLYGTVEETTVVAPDEGDSVLESLTSTTDQLIDDIAAAIEADAFAHPGAPTQGILLCGGTGRMRGLKERLVARVGLPAALGRPWATVVPSRRTEHLLVNGAEDELALLGLTTAVGLAMWKEIV